MASFLPGGIGFGRPAGIPDMGQQQGGIFGSYAPQAGGIFAALKDFADTARGVGSADNFANYQAQNQQSQVRQQLLQGLNSEDPATRQQAYTFLTMNGGNAKPFQDQQAAAALPKLIQSMQPHTENVAQTAPVSLPNLPGQSIQGGGFSFEAPGMGFQDALAQNGNPELQAQLAPKLLDEMMKGPEYRVVGNNLVKLPGYGGGDPAIAMAGPKEAPKTRTYRVGTQDITEEFQPDGTWKRLGAGAAFKPESSGGEGDLGDLSEPAMVNAAVKYNQTGTLPPLGMGKSATALRRGILDLAAKMATGKYTPEQLVANAANYKANTGSLNQQTKVFNAIETSGNAAKNSANLALEAARAGGAGPTGIPAFNRWVQAGRKATGDKNVMNLANHLSTFAEEYAKVMTASTGSAAATDSARSEAHKRLSDANSLDQLEFLMGEMEREMGGRHYAARAQIDATKKQIGGDPYSEPDGVMTKPKPKAAAPAGPAAPLPRLQTAAHPPEIENILKKYGK